MNKERIALMVTMLAESVAGEWMPAARHMRMNAVPKTVGFNLTSWAGTRNGCGFSACAIGHATLDTRFNALGFTVGWNLSPKFGTYTNWGAVEKFLEIKESTAYRLFSVSQYPDGAHTNQSQVIQRLLYLLEHGQKKFLKQYPEIR